MTRTIPLALSVVLPVLFLPFTPVSAEGGLVERVAERYSSLDTYYARGTFFLEARIGETTQIFEAPFVQAASPPGKLRLEIQDEELGSIVVSDGEATWVYFKALNQYRREAAVLLDGGGGEGGQALPGPGAGGDLLGLYRSLRSEGVASEVVGTAEVRLGGRPVPCAVIELVSDAVDSVSLVRGPDTLWVEPDGARVLRSVHRTEEFLEGMTMTTRMELSFAEIVFDEAPPESLFVFSPPEGAAEVEDFTLGTTNRPDMSGQAAPDFRLTDLAGKPHRLENYRGSVVVLDFWASWCAPCRKELPAIERLHRQYGGRGLVVLAVNSELPRAARAFVQKNGYTFTVLTDEAGSVFDDYAVSSIPVTVVIDRDGRISAHFIGFRGEASLLASIREAGIQ